MAVLSTGLRKQLENSVLAARRTAETGSQAVVEGLGVFLDRKPDHVSGDAAILRNGLRAKWRQVGLDADLLISECAFEQWHRLLFARFLAENGLLLHPELEIPVTLDECEELAGGLGEPDGWSVAGRFASQILPGIFRLDDPCVKIRLAPEHRVALEAILAGLPAEVFTSDDSLGWVYQYWQKDSKDEVNASERKVGGADIGPVTQLFTENYMVRFLLENSLGAWWAGRHPTSPMIKGWEYLRFNEDGVPAAGTFAGWPERVAEVTVMDPCCGSGHFLVDAFGMLWRMRAEEDGLSPVAAQDAVLRDNLYGLELDPRCVQIAMFAVAFQAWKDGGGWRPLPVPNIACSGIPVKTPVDEWTALAEGDERLEAALVRLHHLFRDADTLGSLIDPRRTIEGGKQQSFDDVEWEEILPLLELALAREATDATTAVLSADVASIAKAAGYLSHRYSLLATNVPYLGRGRQSEKLQRFLDAFFNDSSQELATAFLERCRHLVPTGTVACVTPENWTYLKSYHAFRRRLLRSTQFHALARLGSGAFAGISGEVVKGLLVLLSNSPVEHHVCLFDVSANRSVDEKADALKRVRPLIAEQRTLEGNPDSIVSFVQLESGPLMESVAAGLQGISSGDNARFTLKFWELSFGSVSRTGRWERLLTAPQSTDLNGGRQYVIRWGKGPGSALTENLGAIRGRIAWGRGGILVSRAGNLPASIYSGELFADSAAVILPNSDDLVPALWCYCSSPGFAEDVRKLNTKLIVANATLVKVPFNVDHWRRVAAERFPDGLPEPWSDDPTQWLFEGRPEVSTSTLQVAVGRLLGFRWPEQPEQDDLDRFADADGIVCLPSVAGEAPAAEQLTDLLAAAFGPSWNAGKLSQLLADAGSKKRTLADWLRDEFFKQHCVIFGNRPFVWHVWDGHPQGFSALVNYHRLDRKTLEKLTYTYLGTNWIERQRAEVRDDEPGAEARLAAAEALKKKLELILKGEAPYDTYIRWKALGEQPVGWEPDLNDGVRLNIRPFVGAGVLRSTFNIHWKKDRGTNPDGSERLNDVHLTLAEKLKAREKH